MCAFIELWGHDLRTTCPSGLRAGAQPAQRPQTKRQRSCGPPRPEAAARAAQRAANFPCNIIRRLRLQRSRPSKAPAKKKRSQPAEQNITKGVTHCLAPVLADCDRNHACGTRPLRHRCSARTLFGLVMRIVGKIRENSSANAKRLFRYCVPRAITGQCAGRNRSEKRFMPLGSDLSQAGRRRFGSVLRAVFGDGIEARAAIGRG